MIYDKLAENEALWRHLGFEPWEHRDMRGVARKITMRKTSILGPVATYYAWDYLVWRHEGERAGTYLLKEWTPLPDVVMQRFLLIGLPGSERKIRSFCFGFKGFLEVYTYTPGGAHHKRVKDLVPPIELAWSKPKTSD